METRITSEERAKRARALIWPRLMEGDELSGIAHDLDEIEEIATGLIVDLLHAVQQEGGDPAKAIRAAQEHFGAEAAG